MVLYHTEGVAMRFLTKIFPKKIETLGEFIRVVREEKITSISITPLLDNNFNAVLVHKAQSNKGRRIVYKEIITLRNGGLATALAFAVAPGAVRRESIRLCLIDEQRVKALQKELPKNNICLIFENKTMESFENLHIQAKAEGIL